MTTTPATRQDVPVGTGEPERLFAVSGLRPREGGYEGSMRTGPWNRSRAGRPTVGSLGVLVDDVLALSVALLSPSGASVSTEIAIDLARAVPTDGRVLTCVGGPVAPHPGGALIQGTVHDDTGELVAVATQRQRYVPAPERFVDRTTATADPVEVLHGLAGDVVRADDRAAFEVAGSSALANPGGHVHGGMSLYLSAAIAEALLLEDGAALDVGSVRIAHVRPMPVDAPVTYTAEVLHAGRSLRLARVTGRSAQGRVYTTATVTLQ